MSDMVQREIEARAKLEHEARAILESAAAEGREPTPEEEERFDKIVADADRKKTTIEKLQAMSAASAEIAEHRAVFETSASVAAAPAVDDATRLVEGIRSAFNGASVAPLTFEWRALATSSDTVPVEFFPQVATYARTLNPIITVATVINSTSGENMTMPRLTSDLTSYTPGEGTAITPSDPTLSSVTLSVTGFKSLTYVSQELAQDSPLAILDIVARSAGRAIGLAAGVEFTTGSNGFITDGVAGATATGTPFFDADDLISLYYSAPAPTRAVGAWMMSNGAISKARKFKTSDGAYLWQPSLSLGQPDTFLGRSVFESPAMASVGSASKSAAFGDWSAYYVKQLPLRVDISRDYRFNTDEVAVKVVYRAGGALPDTTAIRHLVSGNS